MLEIDTTLPWDIGFCMIKKMFSEVGIEDSTHLQSNHRRLICPCTQWWTRPRWTMHLVMTNMFQYYQMSICQIFLIDSYTSTSRPWLRRWQQYTELLDHVIFYHVFKAFRHTEDFDLFLIWSALGGSSSGSTCKSHTEQASTISLAVAIWPEPRLIWIRPRNPYIMPLRNPRCTGFSCLTLFAPIQQL
jgi:hypothetical protein